VPELGSEGRHDVDRYLFSGAGAANVAQFERGLLQSLNVHLMLKNRHGDDDGTKPSSFEFHRLTAI
jgi:hypothetical protein